MDEDTQHQPAETEALKIRFGTSRDKVKMSTFIAGMRSSQLIVPNVVNLMFERRVRANLYVGPPRPGSVLLDIYIHLGGSFGSLVAIHKTLELEFCKRFYKSLFDSELDLGLWGDKAGLFVRDMCIAVFRKPTVLLKDGLPDSKAKDKILEGKAELFDACTADSDIAQLEFEGPDERVINRDPPILRDNFLKHTSAPREINYERRRYILDAYIVSPVILEKHDEPWRLETTRDHRVLQAKMRDREFKDGVLKNIYSLRENGWAGTVTVLVEENVNSLTQRSSPTHRFIKTVYRFNGRELKPLPRGEELQGIEVSSDQQKIFPFDNTPLDAGDADD